MGDVHQHGSAEAGDFLPVLEAHSALRRCQVGEIHRQIPADYRAAVRTPRYTEQPMQWNVSHHRRLFPPLMARKKHGLFRIFQNFLKIFLEQPD
jgi:hypothetical protein